MRATPEGTARFVQRGLAIPAHYRQTADELWASSIGVGTYLGEADDATDSAYEAAFSQALARGVNLFDCAVNYRFQRSERALGRWLARAIATGAVSREEVILATKGGFVPYDGEMPAEPRRWVSRQFLDNGLVHPHDFAARYQHCMAPAYLETMIGWSLRNLGVETIDIYYLHNPETQSIALSDETFRTRLLDAFETLELAVERGQIAAYGAATWTAFRTLPSDPGYLSITQMVSMATEVAGQGHHFRYVQMPYNLFMTEAFAFENQQVGEAFMSAIEAANELGLTVMTSAPLMQGRLTVPIIPRLPQMLPGLQTDAQRAIQFARSSPGVTAALVGMKTPDHVAENLALTVIPPVAGEMIRAMYNAPREDDGA